MESIAAVARLHAYAPSCVIVVVSIYDDIQTKLRAEAVGAAAFVSKRVTPERLPSTIRWAAMKER
jgi:DNA-binding NarL/FixJ family response regulator